MGQYGGQHELKANWTLQNRFIDKGFCMTRSKRWKRSIGLFADEFLFGHSDQSWRGEGERRVFGFAGSCGLPSVFSHTKSNYRSAKLINNQSFHLPLLLKLPFFDIAPFPIPSFLCCLHIFKSTSQNCTCLFLLECFPLQKTFLSGAKLTCLVMFFRLPLAARFLDACSLD